MVGQGGRIDELVTAMNRAAEQAVPASKDCWSARAWHERVRCEGHPDRWRNLGHAVLRRQDAHPLTERFLPIVTTATARVKLADKYNAIAGKASGLGLMKDEDANIQATSQANRSMACTGDRREERKIRQDPRGQWQRDPEEGLRRAALRGPPAREFESPPPCRCPDKASPLQNRFDRRRDSGPGERCLHAGLQLARGAGGRW